jgi:hypothetical protein
VVKVVLGGGGGRQVGGKVCGGRHVGRGEKEGRVGRTERLLAAALLVLRSLMPSARVQLKGCHVNDITQ